jgi:molybdate transport repressor ModE-like protein
MSGDDERIRRLEPRWKLWLEDDGDYVFGPGAFAILKSIRDFGTIAEGAKKLGMSYRYVWGVINKIEEQLDLKLLDTRTGGKDGGGSTLTPIGYRLIDLYQRVRDAFNETANNLNR